ncbi:MAG TPA: DUF4476 domain-containing protein [Bacteroidales bacterium]|nr:DUF4476 domain-containing protein [Bacteroidales bacterium]
MKTLTLLLSLVIISTSLVAQVEKPHKPMSGLSYKIYCNRLEKPKKEKRRMKKGIRMMKFKYISSNQLYKAAKIFTDDQMRLLYVKDVYPKVSDKSNAIIICDAFDNFSHSQIMWDYIKEQNPLYGVPIPDMESYTDYLDLKDRKKDRQKDDLVKNDNDKVKNDNIEDKPIDKDQNVDSEIIKKEVEKNDIDKDSKIIEETVEKPETVKISFPDPLNYKGNKGCDGYLSDKQFLAFANSLAQFESDEDKAKICMEYVYTYCFNTAQVMKLAMLMEGENYRYVFFKTAYEKVYDRDNFLYVKQLLTSSKLINGINEIYVVPGVEKPYATGTEESINKCLVSDSDYEKVKTEIRKESFSTTRSESAKVFIKQYECFTAKQIYGLLPLFSLEADKLEIAKYSYRYCIDRNNYSVVRDFFTSADSKNEVSEYIKNYSD